MRASKNRHCFDSSRKRVFHGVLGWAIMGGGHGGRGRDGAFCYKIKIGNYRKLPRGSYRCNGGQIYKFVP